MIFQWNLICIHSEWMCIGFRDKLIIVLIISDDFVYFIYYKQNLQVFVEAITNTG